MGGGTFQKVYELTARIPPGRVTTYGQIAVYLGALLIGPPRRLFGLRGGFFCMFYMERLF